MECATLWNETDTKVVNWTGEVTPWEPLVSVCYTLQPVLPCGPFLCTLEPCVTASQDYNQYSAGAYISAQQQHMESLVRSVVLLLVISGCKWRQHFWLRFTVEFKRHSSNRRTAHQQKNHQREKGSQQYPFKLYGRRFEKSSLM